MRTFRCNCGAVVYFENTRCLSCGSALGYLPDLARLAALDEAGEGLWRPRLGGHETRRYRACRHYTEAGVCNWLVPEEESDPYCRACRLNEVIPDLGRPGARDAWARVEAAKRRLVYSLDRLALPVVDKARDPEHGLAFAFLEDLEIDLEVDDAARSGRILTGHLHGTITINLAEADPSARERAREAMAEPYRTLLGHFRHESGHYYWFRLVGGGPWLEPFRALFGDERADYAAALARHHREGPPADWARAHISAYAAAHPLEDWAETWAHYLHLYDTLEMAEDYGLTVQGRALRAPREGGIGTCAAEWFTLTRVLNDLNRCLGHGDAYPFAPSAGAFEKLLFVERVIAAERTGA